MSMPQSVVLGEGRLSWTRSERIGDRYGAVMLMRDGDSLNAPSGYLSMNEAPVGQFGRLVATILETRESTHIGDLFRGLFTPDDQSIGEVVVLGEGELFREVVTSESIPVVGLRPADARVSDWLNPQALYRCHEQTVRLSFESATTASALRFEGEGCAQCTHARGAHSLYHEDGDDEPWSFCRECGGRCEFVEPK